MSVIATPDRAMAAPVAHGSRPRTVAAWYLLAVVSGVATLAVSAGPILDPDVFWHVKVGEALLHHLRVPVPDPWAFTLPGVHWQPTEWLAEVVLAVTHNVGGYAGIVALRFVLAVALLALLARLVLPGRTPWVGALVFSVTALPLIAFVQARPALAALLFVVWLAGVCQRARAELRLPRLATVAALTWLWANVHGSWVLVPGCLVLVALAVLIDGDAESRWAARWLVVRALVALGAAGLTPVGPALWLTPLKVTTAASSVIEWAPTQFTLPETWGVVGLLVMLLVCWARSRQQIPRSELFFVVAVVVFAALAIRNVAPASLLLAPVAAARLEAAYGGGCARQRVSVAALAGVSALGLLGGVAVYAHYPAVSPNKPWHIAARLAAQPSPLRVLDAYNISGFLIAEGAPNVRVAIDGRTDRYGAAYIADYASHMLGQGDWRGWLDGLRPDVAVIERGGPLVDLLEHERGWTLVQTDHAYALLSAPGVRVR